MQGKEVIEQLFKGKLLKCENGFIYRFDGKLLCKYPSRDEIVSELPFNRIFEFNFDLLVTWDDIHLGSKFEVMSGALQGLVLKKISPFYIECKLINCVDNSGNLISFNYSSNEWKFNV